MRELTNVPKKIVLFLTVSSDFERDVPPPTLFLYYIELLIKKVLNVSE